MMPINRRRQAKKLLQQDVNVSRRAKILPANDAADALQGIIMDDREVIARRRILASQDNVAEQFWTRCYLAFRIRSFVALDKNQTSEIFAQQVL